MNYKLKKDLPFYKKGEERTIKEWANLMQSPSESAFKIALESGDLDEQFEPIPERIELEQYFEDDKYCIAKKDGKKFQPNERVLMEKAANGELLDIDSLDDTIYHINGSQYTGTYLKSLLKEYLKQKK